MVTRSVIFLLGVFVLFVTPLAISQAASLYIDPPQSTLYRGDSQTFLLRLDVDEKAGECVNTVDAVIEYSANIEPVDVSIGDSIFNVWVETPTIDRDARRITFAGGIPNGYCGRVAGDPRLTNTLAKLVFQLPGFAVGGGGDTVGSISFSDESTAYLNDGRGTKAPLTTYGAQLTLEPKPSDNFQNQWREEVTADRTPPEEFSISLEKDAKAFSQKYFIVFSTTDKQTGVDHYEVMEEPLAQFGSFQWGRADAPWIEARSPYVLRDQSLNSIIRVRAIDKAGNERIATLMPDSSLRTLSEGQVLTIILVVAGVALALIIGLITLLVWKRRKRVVTSGDTRSDTVGEIHDAEL